MCLSNLTRQETDVAELIIEMYLYKDPSALMGFYPKDIYQEKGFRFGNKWQANNTINQTINKRMRHLLEKKALIQPMGKRTEYFLVKDGCLYRELRKRVANKINR